MLRPDQESRELTEERDGADQEPHGEKLSRRPRMQVRASQRADIVTSARQCQLAVGLRNWMAPSAVSTTVGDRPAPGILAREDREKHRRLHQPGKTSGYRRLTRSDPNTPSAAALRKLMYPGCTSCTCRFRVSPVQDPLRDVGVVPFVGRIPESVVVGVEQEHGRQHRDRSGRGALRHPSPTRGRPELDAGDGAR